MLTMSSFPAPATTPTVNKKRITGQEKAHQEPSLGEYNGGEQQITGPTRNHLRQQINQAIGIGQAPPNVQ